MKVPAATSYIYPCSWRGRQFCKHEVKEEDDCRSSSTTTSSWVGMNSDDVSGRSSYEDEVQSSFNGGLDTMDSLQRVLPVRRGISSFYNGKSKSFTNLAEATSISTVKEIAKPETAYARRRRNLLAMNHAWNKKLKRSSKSTLPLLAVAMSATTSDDSASNFMPSTSSSFAPNLKPQPFFNIIAPHPRCGLMYGTVPLVGSTHPR
ncbi:uncharacterized protein LOC120218903 [Hibiscus syriacus]|uniref:uncharacterized protein LOC120218903 n=1 Tax=Hibiscus syriacus TaxID=106335 RepID=UPI0019218AC3|nr:uncharacterized protein LOC120218903 [Hibiscus syriacus]